MKLIELIKNLDILEFYGNTHREVSGIAYHSDQVKENYIFVAIKGYKTDGHHYINDAVAKGAGVIVFHENIEIMPNITLIKVANTRTALSTISANFYNNPSHSLKIIGITGTNGKTTTTYLLKTMLDISNIKTATIGTLGVNINGQYTFTSHTTPESPELHKALRAAVQTKVKVCIIEVSSHSLQLSRVNDCCFNMAIFTNLTHEHLDFHGNLESYYNTKKQLFYKTTGFNIVNVDDFFGNRLIKEINSLDADILTYGVNRPADIYANKIVTLDKASMFQLNTPKGKTHVTINIPGIFNIYNSLAAAACGYALGLKIAQIKRGLEAVKGIPGRFESIKTNKEIHIIIDFAHTPDGFDKLLGTISKFTKGRIILVFGCVGERDPSKRGVMGRIAEKYCDLCILTTDNCRSENPVDIIEDIKRGFINKNNYIEILDRAEAIRYAIANSRKYDTVIITGKGHDKRQIIGNNVMPFDEKEVILKALKEIGENPG